MQGKLIGLIGAPGAGKSTCAAWLFANLRLAGARCELVGEFAKDLFWDESNAWKDQLYVFANQWRMVDRVLKKTDIVVTSMEFVSRKQQGAAPQGQAPAPQGPQFAPTAAPAPAPNNYQAAPPQAAPTPSYTPPQPQPWSGAPSEDDFPF